MPNVLTALAATLILQPFFGNLHSHTSYSDGKKLPSDAFEYARNIAGLDFLAVTDHIESMSINKRYSHCQEQADKANDSGSFIALCGFEFGIANLSGHITVLGSRALFPPYQNNLNDFYHSLNSCSSCIAFFSHPKYEDRQTFNNWEYIEAADQKLHGFEFNGDNKSEWKVYFDALDSGWHISPLWNQDNHGVNWGTKNEARTGIWASELTRDNILDALKMRRTFATSDSDAWVWLSIGDIPMGSTIKKGEVEISIVAYDPTDVIERITLYSNGQMKVASHVCNSKECIWSWQGNVLVGYYVAFVWESDGDFLASAPIWIE